MKSPKLDFQYLQLDRPTMLLGLFILPLVPATDLWHSDMSMNIRNSILDQKCTIFSKKRLSLTQNLLLDTRQFNTSPAESDCPSNIAAQKI